MVFRPMMLARMVLACMMLLASVVVVVVAAISPAVSETEVTKLSENSEPTAPAMPVLSEMAFLEVFATCEMDLGFPNCLRSNCGCCGFSTCPSQRDV